MNNIGKVFSGVETQRSTLELDLKFFDSLPRRIRDALNYSEQLYGSESARQALDEGYSIPWILKRIGKMDEEEHAAAVEAGALPPQPGRGPLTPRG